MGDAGFQLSGVRDLRIAAHAISAHPAWLWSADGLRLLWCNATAASAFGIHDPLHAKTFSIADPRARQVAQLAGRLLPDVVRLERLRDFGKPLGGLLTCACTLIDVEAETAVLIVAMELLGRAPATEARLQWLVDSLDQPASAFDGDGYLAATNAEARDLAGGVRTLSDLGQTETAGNAVAAVQAGRIESKFYAVGNDRDRATIAVMSLCPAKEPVASKPEPVMTEVVHAESLLAATGEPDRLQPAQTYESASVASGMPAVDGGELATDRRHPLRFVWQMNAEGRFSLGGDEFSRMLGPQTAAALGRPWNEIALAFGLDPEGRVAKAVATRDIWSGIMVNWPFDGAGSRLPVELSALPLHDRAHNFLGYRGFGICRDLDGLNRIASIRQQDGLFGEQATTEPAPAQDNDSTMDYHTPTPVAEIETEATPVETPLNILPFRPLADTQTPVLTQVENNAFDEIARRLSEGLGATRTQSSAEVESPFEPFADIDTAASEASIAAPRTDEPDRGHVTPQDIGESVAPWLSLAATPPSGQSVADRPLLDLMPAGILIYRLEHLLYANTALLARIGFANLPALQAAGGLEALEIEPQSSSASSTSADGMPLTVTAAHAKTPPALGRLFSIQWDDEPAHALVLSTETIEPVVQTLTDEAISEPESRPGTADLNAVLEAATDAIVLFNRSGAVTACNRRAQTLFGYPGADFTQRNLTDLFAFESQRIVLDYFESVDQPGIATIHDHGREVVGCKQGGQFLPLSMTMGRSDGERFFAVFRDLSQIKQNEAELLNARRKADRATSAKSDVLAKISHDIRVPLNTIIGFANMMIEEKLGSIGNNRYLEYTKDIRSSAEHVLTIIGDMLDLSEVETGKIKLDFQQQSLNDAVEKCVGLAQPQANRDRIIIRTSLAHHLPLVLADIQSLRQIATNLITSSIRLSKAGGQVIVSTALDESRSVVLRVRDMGRGLSDTEIATTMDPYRAQAVSDMVMPDTGVDLSLTKALAEANHARFHIKTTPQAGTLIEVVFPAA